MSVQKDYPVVIRSVLMLLEVIIVFVIVGLNSYMITILVRVSYTVNKYKKLYSLIDINECSQNNGGCEDTCTNTMGSYECSCQATGYSLNNDKHNCSGKWLVLNDSIDFLIIDINECSINNGGCVQSCTNIPGSYYCSCETGYSLNFNGHGCTGISNKI